MKLTDIATAGLPNIRAELGLETPLQTQMRQMQQGQILGQQFQGLPAPIASLAQGIAGNIPSVVDNTRKGAMSLGATGLETKGELFDKALSYYDGTPQSRARVVQELTRVDPNFGSMMANRMRATDIAEAQALSTTMFNTARADQLNREAGELAGLRETIRPFLAGSKFNNLSEENFNKLGETALNKIFDELTEKQNLKLLHGVNEDGSQAAIWLNENDGKFYSSNDTSRQLKPEEVPQNIYNASVVASSADQMYGGNKGVTDLIDRTLQTQNLMFTTDKLLTALEDNPDILTNVASFGTFMNNTLTELKALEKTMFAQAAQNDDVNLSGAEIQSALDKFVGTGQDAAIARPLILSLAYSMAAAEQGAQSISDMDIVNYMEQIGANQADANIMMAVLRNNATKAHLAYQLNYALIHNNEVPASDFGYSQIMKPMEIRRAERLAATLQGR